MVKKDILNSFTIFVAIITLITFILNMVNGRFHLGDFMVYYTAAENLISGKPIYLVSFYSGSGFYKYSPTTLFIFLPYVFFNFKTAAVIHFFILGIAYWYTLNLIRKLIEDYFPLENIKHVYFLLSVSFVCILIHFTREMYLGNVNILLLMLCCLSIRNILTGKAMQGGMLLGIVIITKPYLAILLLPLLLRRKWRVIGWLCLTAACGLIIPFIFFGPLRGMDIYGEWVKSIMIHGEDFPGKTSIDYFIRFHIPSWPEWGILVVFFFICSIVIMFILRNIRMEKQKETDTSISDMNFIFEWFLLIALLPNLIKADWVLLLFSTPLIMLMIFDIVSRKKYVWIIVLIPILFFYGANSDDLLGKAVSHTILESGFMGLSNFLLVMVSLCMFLSLRSSAHTSALSGRVSGKD
ncbi:MAG: glycosyltransferase family 87 protein [Bacteroidota bacterium]